MSSFMRWSLDARTPLRLLGGAAPGLASPGPASPGAVVLAEDGAPLPGRPARVERFAAPPATAHPAGCACCQPRNPVAIALDRLFLARTKGEVPWFDSIVAVARTEEGRAAIRAALEHDSVARARFRLEGQEE
ncbi:hypothetical protein [Teichococcus rhizosphaerae]|nr:hypothetical protein [Pseudoroseomonas rhizosphaerae]